MQNLYIPRGNEAKEAVASLQGYIYQLYQTAIEWADLGNGEFLFIEVAEDYSVLAGNALKAVQVKGTESNVTINSDDIIASIESFIELTQNNLNHDVSLRHLTTSRITTEKESKYRIGDTPTLISWRRIAKTGDMSPLRQILYNSKLSNKAKDYLKSLDDDSFREGFLRRIHFDCGANEHSMSHAILKIKLDEIVKGLGGRVSQVESCISDILYHLLNLVCQHDRTQRFVTKQMLEEKIESNIQVSLSPVQFDTQINLLNQLVQSHMQSGNSSLFNRISSSSPIQDVPLPREIIERAELIDKITTSLFQCGFSWIYGAAGMGKTTGALIACKKLRGNWVRVNLRGATTEEANISLRALMQSSNDKLKSGIFVDDLNCSQEQYLIDTLLLLVSLCSKNDTPLILTSASSLDTNVIFSSNLPDSVQTRFSEFTESEVREILSFYDKDNDSWVRYIYLVSGGGHPQLANAAIKEMQRAGWDRDELKTMRALLSSSGAVEKVRVESRQRLLSELPDSSRELLQRISLKSGHFSRELLLDVANAQPTIDGAGLILEQLVGTWVDQQGKDLFSLSPLLNNLADVTLTQEQKNSVHWAISSSIVKQRMIEPADAQSAFVSALISKNESAIISICYLVMLTDDDMLDTVASFFPVLVHLDTSAPVYKDNFSVNQHIRLAQLLLVARADKEKSNLQKTLQCFISESSLLGNDESEPIIRLMAYMKLLVSIPKSGVIENFLSLLLELKELLSLIALNEHLYDGLLSNLQSNYEGDVSLIGSLFSLQINGLDTIGELVRAFEFLNGCDGGFREELLSLFDREELSLEQLVAPVWLSELKANTIEPEKHLNAYAHMEALSSEWGRKDIAIYCRKYQVVIMDESANDFEEALKLVNQGLNEYSEDNECLLRAKAKVFFRANLYGECLEVSKQLISDIGPVNYIDRAYFLREAAICAEHLNEYIYARELYIAAAEGAKKSELASMHAMNVGLIADSEIAAWHGGEKKVFLEGYCNVLDMLSSLDANSSLSASHCHATARHALLFLQQEMSADKVLLDDGMPVQIYPGVVSNPEPHKDIAEFATTPLEVAWYMLGVLESLCLVDCGVASRLKSSSEDKISYMGNTLLTDALMNKSIITCDRLLFVQSLQDTVLNLAFAKEQKDINEFGINVLIDKELLTEVSDESLYSFSTFVEQSIIVFTCHGIFSEQESEVKSLIETLGDINDCHLHIRDIYLENLVGCKGPIDFETHGATLICEYFELRGIGATLMPKHVFKILLKSLLAAKSVDKLDLISQKACEWYVQEWSRILKDLRSELMNISIYEEDIIPLLESDSPNYLKRTIALLKETLPTLMFKDEEAVFKQISSLNN
jgi:hypothetical protein